MTIQDELRVELTDALKTGDRNRKDVIRAIETEVSRAKSEPSFEGDVDDLRIYDRALTDEEIEALYDLGE